MQNEKKTYTVGQQAPIPNHWPSGQEYEEIWTSPDGEVVLRILVLCHPGAPGWRVCSMDRDTPGILASVIVERPDRMPRAIELARPF